VLPFSIIAVHCMTNCSGSICFSFCQAICPSHLWTVLKQLNNWVSSSGFHHHVFLSS